MKISILDCTLRDGGYINNFHFGVNRISIIKEKLCDTNIDIIECGFLQSGVNDPNSTLYGCLEQIHISKLPGGPMYVAMVDYGKINIEEIPEYKPNFIDGIRLSFHKHKWEDAKCFAKNLISKGYKVFIQPMVTMSYTDKELLALINDVNLLNPFALYIVDTLGSMYKDDLLYKFYLFENNLAKNICLGFHPHNNMQLAFANAMTLLELHTDRHIIIDSSVFGMGRGAGNLNTELITHYINSKIEKRYNQIPILELIDDVILPIYKYSTWGFSEPYYLSAILGVHPNHATYLIDKQSVGMAKIFELINKLPNENKHLFIKNDIETLYYNEMRYHIEDSEAIKDLSIKMSGREILVIAPGSSVRKYSEKIGEYIKSNCPFVIAINFVPDGISSDLIFISNRKRFNKLGETNIPIVATSNINNKGMSGKYMINYDSLFKENSDSSGIMVLRLLKLLGIESVKLAGYDGFTTGDNHYNINLDSYLSDETVTSLNNSMKKQLSDIAKSLSLEFITPSAYEVI